MKTMIYWMLTLVALGGSGRAETPALVTSPRASVLINGGAMMDGNHFADTTRPAMREHYAGVQRVALVLWASVPEDRDRMEARLQEAFRHLGDIEAVSLHRFDDAGGRRVLREVDGIFVGGGDTFALLRKLYESRQLEVIRERVRAGVVYGGASAGANVAGLKIGGTNDFPVTDVPSLTALAVFPAVINPHHPTAEQEQDFKSRDWKIRNYLRWNPDQAMLALGDRAMARLHGGRVTIPLGPAWIYTRDGVRELTTGDEVPEVAPR